MRYKWLRVSLALIMIFVFTGWLHHETVFATNSDKKSTLKITNLAEPGTEIPEDLYFLLQVKVDGVMLPVGTTYLTESESRTVASAGQILLRVNETAVLENMFLPESKFRITELSAAFDGYLPVYRGIGTPNGSIASSIDGIWGVFPPGGDVHITVINRDSN